MANKTISIIGRPQNAERHSTYSGKVQGTLSINKVMASCTNHGRSLGTKSYLLRIKKCPDYGSRRKT